MLEGFFLLFWGGLVVRPYVVQAGREPAYATHSSCISLLNAVIKGVHYQPGCP